MNPLCSIDVRRLLPWACGLLLLAPSVQGQTASAASEAPPSNVEARVEEGIQLRRQGKDREALLAFEAAHRGNPTSARVRAHLAASYQALGKWLEADAHLSQLLAEQDDPYVRRHRELLERAADYVARHVGTLFVSGGPAGAELRLDDRRVGTLPMIESVRLVAGSHELEVTQAGYHPVRRPVWVAGGDRLKEDVELVPIAVRSLARVPSAGVTPAPISDRRTSSTDAGPSWLSWTLAGLTGGAAVATGLALFERNRRATHWNSDACLRPGASRGDLCRDTLEAGKAAERVAYWSAAATAALGAGTIISWMTSAHAAHDESKPQLSRERAHCDIGLGEAFCSVRF